MHACRKDTSLHSSPVAVRADTRALWLPPPEAAANAEGFATRRDKRPFTKAIVWWLIDHYLGEEYLGSRRPTYCIECLAPVLDPSH